MSKNASAIRNLFETVSLGTPEKAIGFVLWRVLHRYIREIDHVLSPHDLTHLQFTALAMAAWLGRDGSTVKQCDIASFSNIHPMQLSQMLKSLEGKGLVIRKRSASDVRAKQIEITAAGIAALRRSLPAVIQVQGHLFGSAGRPGGHLLSALLRIEA